MDESYGNINPKLVELFNGDKLKSLEASNIALMFGEYLAQEGANEFYWYKSLDDKIEFFYNFMDKYRSIVPYVNQEGEGYKVDPNKKSNL